MFKDHTKQCTFEMILPKGKKIGEFEDSLYLARIGHLIFINHFSEKKVFKPLLKFRRLLFK